MYFCGISLCQTSAYTSVVPKRKQSLRALVHMVKTGFMGHVQLCVLGFFLYHYIVNIFHVDESLKYDKGLIALICKELLQGNKKLMEKQENGHRTRTGIHRKKKKKERKEKTVAKHEKIKRPHS